MGGMLAQELAYKYPEKFSSLILLSTASSFVCNEMFPFGKKPAEIKLLSKAIKKDSIEAMRNFNKLLSPERPELKQGSYKEEELLAGLKYLENFDSSSYIQSLKIPTLIFHAKDDAIVDYRGSHLLDGKISNSRVEIFEIGGHDLFFSKAGVLAKEIKEFLVSL